MARKKRSKLGGERRRLEKQLTAGKETTTATIRKRPREISTPEMELIEIYEDLANEKEEIRLKAAQKLLQSHAELSRDSLPKIQKILNRLFRGLCSNRKAARLGFSVALTELLSQISGTGSADELLTPRDVVDILKLRTVIEAKELGQDERDLCFGRIFGAEAVIKSGILFKPKPNLPLWQDLLQFVLDVAVKKSWARQECGWLFYSSISQLAHSNLEDEFPLAVLEALRGRELIRTPEGVAIWLEVNTQFPDINLPKKQWKHADPLGRSEVKSLAEVMKDARPKKHDGEEKRQSQGTGAWSQQLHFAWDIVLREFLAVEVDPLPGASKRSTFAKFWTKVVAESLFSFESSHERKSWGLLLMAKTIPVAPSYHLESILHPTIVLRLSEWLSDKDHPLRRSAERVIHLLEVRADKDHSAAAPALRSLLEPSTDFQFGSVTSNKTISKLIQAADLQELINFLPEIQKAVEKPGDEEGQDPVSKRRAGIDLLVLQYKRGVTSSTKERAGVKLAEAALDDLISVAYPSHSLQSSVYPFVPALDVSSRDYARLRIRVCLDDGLQQGEENVRFFRHCIKQISAVRIRAEAEGAPIQFDNETEKIFAQAWQNLTELWKGQETSLPSGVESTESWELLYGLAVLQLFDGEKEAPDLLEDLNSAFADSSSQQGPKALTDKGHEALVETILGFASKSSKSLHSICLKAFRASARQLTRGGVDSMVRILEAKEKASHGNDLFELGGDDDELMEDVNQLNGYASSERSGSESLDSDVEFLDMISDDGEGDDAENAEVEEFEAKLVAALGTRKGQEDINADDTDGSDVDLRDDEMDDAEMTALDEKLAEVFRARKDKSNEKKERKDIKQAILNMKRRVLDLVEIYWRLDNPSSLALELLLPLIQTAKTTTEKQISERCHRIVQGFFTHCSKRGVKALPQVTGDEVMAIRNILVSVHEEVGRDSSKVHSTSCSKASLLLVKVLIKAGVNVGEMVDIYGGTRKSQLLDEKCKVHTVFFTEWDNWCASARRQFVGDKA